MLRVLITSRVEQLFPSCIYLLATLRIKYTDRRDLPCQVIISIENLWPCKKKIKVCLVSNLDLVNVYVLCRIFCIRNIFSLLLHVLLNFKYFFFFFWLPLSLKNSFLWLWSQTFILRFAKLTSWNAKIWFWIDFIDKSFNKR